MTDPVIAAVAAVFETDAAELTEDSSSSTIKGWDSLGQIRLVAEMEFRFGVEFDLMEIPDLTSIARIRGLLRAKGQNV
jgi:acyl carrier protein